MLIECLKSTMDKIFSATYSGVPVYEYLIPTGSVMRRKSDSWVNATHILKTANFPKAKRTRILERDVQVGEHEKVQGGYGKYQGTWVPLQRAKEIAKQFEVYEILEPLFEVTTLFPGMSPPPAPKHRHEKSASVIEKAPPPKRKAALARKTASTPVMKTSNKITTTSRTSKAKERAKKAVAPVSNPNEGVFVGKRHVQSASNLATNDLHPPDREGSPEMDINDGIDSDIEDPSSLSIISPSSPSEFMSEVDLANALKSPNEALNQTARESLERVMNHGDEHRDTKWIDSNSDFTSRLLEYFLQPDEMVDDSILPDFLAHPPNGLKVDEVIDDDGNTMFHWACAMGSPQVAEVVITLGANYRAVNNAGETPLMKAVQFTNSYVKKTFPRIVALVSETCFEFDANHRTVLHHIAAAATSKSRVPSALYYMDIVIAKVSEGQSSERVESFLNCQDNTGDTVLHICAKNANRKCIKLLLNFKAKTNIRNNSGQIASDILLENENLNPKVQERYEMHMMRGRKRSRSVESVAEPHVSEAAIEATHKVSQFIVDSLNELSNIYDDELGRKESDVQEVKQLLTNMHDETVMIENKTKEFLGEALDNEKLTKHISFVQDQVKRHELLVKSKEVKLRRMLERSQKRFLENAMKDETKRDCPVGSEDSLSVSIELTRLQISRGHLLDEILRLYSGVHAQDDKMKKYKRLISESADIPLDEVSSKLEDLLEEIESASN